MRFTEFTLRATRGNEAPIQLSVRFRKHWSSKGNHSTSCKIARVDSSTLGGTDTSVLAVAFARLGDADRGRYDFWAGSRIALERALARLLKYGHRPEFVRPLRRVLQVELALAQNDEEGFVTGEKLNRLARQRDVLFNVKAALTGANASALKDADIARNADPLPDFLRGARHHFVGELPSKPEAYKAHAPAVAGPSEADFPPVPTPVFPACASLLTGNADNPVPAECAECQGDPECCQKNGGL